MAWYALYTKPRAELKVAQQLEDLGLEIYCPVITEVKQWSDRKKKITSPLFRSYVFINTEEKDRERVFDVPGVVRYLTFLGKPAIVKDHEIETLKMWLADEDLDDLMLEEMSVGDKITIANGALKDQKAIIKEVGKKRLRLIIPSLGFTVNVRLKDII